jgi:acetyltransferase-like isoleucine patch superfamily enzyme
VPSGRRQHLDEAGKLTERTIYETVTIGRETWVGEGAIIMANVGRRCIVSAGAVVTKEMPDNVVIGGNPARVIRTIE